MAQGAIAGRYVLDTSVSYALPLHFHLTTNTNPVLKIGINSDPDPIQLWREENQESDQDVVERAVLRCRRLRWLMFFMRKVISLFRGYKAEFGS